MIPFAIPPFFKPSFLCEVSRMPFALEQLTQALSVVDVINQQAINNTTVYSNGVDMRQFHRLMYIIQCGSLVLPDL